MNPEIAKHHEHLKRLKEDPQYREQYKREEEERRQAWWLTLKPFTGPDQVPQLPKPLTPFYLEQLHRLGMIPHSELQHGQWYIGDNRNAQIAKWNAQEEHFYLLRYKWGYRWETARHPQNDDGFALFTPIRLATPQEIEKEEEKIPNL